MPFQWNLLKDRDIWTRRFVAVQLATNATSLLSEQVPSHKERETNHSGRSAPPSGARWRTGCDGTRSGRGSRA